MYFPILRGKLNELLVLRELSEKLSLNRVITPIIEPVKHSTGALIKCLDKLNDSGIPNILLCNPSCGELEYGGDTMNELISKISSDYENTSFAYWLYDHTTHDELESFINSTGQKGIYFLHSSPYFNPSELTNLSGNKFQANLFINNGVSRSYKEQFNGLRNAVVQDNFKRKDSNALYRNSPIELFTDQHLHFIDDGHIGFGDYSAIGQHYTDGGGQANTVAIHIVYENMQNSEVWIQHFLSNTYTVNRDRAAMIDEAVTQAIIFLNENPQIYEYSTACNELRDYSRSNSSTSLGWLKKISIKHHFELMIHLLSR